jgi:hypothetical protein
MDQTSFRNQVSHRGLESIIFFTVAFSSINGITCPFTYSSRRERERERERGTDRGKEGGREGQRGREHVAILGDVCLFSQNKKDESGGSLSRFTAFLFFFIFLPKIVSHPRNVRDCR